MAGGYGPFFPVYLIYLLDLVLSGSFFIGWKEAVFQLLLLLLAGSGAGRIPFRRGTRFLVFFMAALAAGIAKYIEWTFLKTETQIPVWEAFLYVFPACAACMASLHVVSTNVLCKIHLTGKNDWRDIGKELRERGLVKKPDALLLIIHIIVLAIIAYIWHDKYDSWRHVMAYLFVMALSHGLIMYAQLPRYRNYLQSIGKIA